MASPQVSSVIDPSKNGRYTLQLSDKLLGTSSSSDNHKPAQSTEKRNTTIKADNDGSCSLSITDEEPTSAEPQQYTYEGVRKSHKKTYVLVFNQDKQTCSLEPLEDTYSFNLTSTPWESSKSKLQTQYRQLKETSSDDESGRKAEAANVPSDGSDQEPDPTKPYDFRRFLHLVPEQSSPPNEPFRSATGTPRSEHGRSTPIMNNDIREPPTKPTRSVKSQAASSRKRKTPEPSSTAAKSFKSAAVPTVRLDRRASTRPTDLKPAARPSTKPKVKPDSQFKSDPLVHSSDDSDGARDGPARFELSDGGLQIDFGDAAPRKRHYSTTVPLASATDGPISLRSAASSAVNSAANTPLPGRKKHDDVPEFDLGSSVGGDESDEDDGYREDDEGERDAEGDEDIEPMDLGPPAHGAGRKSEEGRVEAAEVDVEDDEAGFEAEMMQELMSGAAESDEESEEE
ncbi:hypothetical protein W97_02506 [Coniosporium apollinis CBS 100218]|uniref:Transcription elongation factor Eaf N-terminal domain-containing protein n=1 Tax=Coniosporium apollinis (strain CBS 100218) TaxID=1168221 RepID=R7YN86_CONA1|nr:uncharacterized protein W97_02506 [Coniosporium apollinis CBS 100218]EON63279.1 hypothetical protein W97_02506 [Coniosporium apollinis CBS 100218]